MKNNKLLFATELSRNCWQAAAATWEEVATAYRDRDVDYAEKLRIRATAMVAMAKRVDAEIEGLNK